MAAADGAAGARQPAIGDAAPSVAGSLAGNGASAAGDAGPDRSQYLGRAAGKSVAGRRGNAVVASMTASDDSTAQTAGSVESTLTGRAGDQENQPGNANPAGPSLAKATTFDLPTAANPAKSDAAAVAVKSNALPTTAQAQGTGPAQGPSSLGAPAASATGQAAAGAPAASATGQAAPSASQADRVRLVERVAAAFEAAGDQGGTVRLRLHPPELGAVKVEVNVRNGVMNAHLETETSAARSLLLDNLPALRDRLAQQQIKVERFDVDLAGQSSGGTPQDAHQQARQQSQPYSTAKQNRPGGPQAAESAAALPAVRTAARGRFDVTI
jgi:flagellar hook-length control protein FliK